MAENRKPSSPPLTYAEAGVSIEAGAALVERIKPLAAATRRPGVMAGIGGFGALFDLAAAGYRDPVLVSGTDGVGTKLKLAQMAGIHDTVGIDLVAMCVNDLVVQGAEPLFFLDYFACGTLGVDQAEAVLRGVAEGCRQAGCALVGGETAEMPGMYAGGEYDLAGFAVGAVERAAILPKPGLAPGDALIGLASGGLHSNGFSLVRKILERSGVSLSAPAPFDARGRSFGPALLDPTRIYVKPCLEAIRATGGAILALAHITGGGLAENLPRVLSETLAARIDLSAWALPPVFRWLMETGPVSRDEALRAFNCGIGMVAACRAEEAGAVLASFVALGETACAIGTLEAREGGAKIRFTGDWAA